MSACPFAKSPTSAIGSPTLWKQKFVWWCWIVQIWMKPVFPVCRENLHVPQNMEVNNFKWTTNFVYYTFQLQIVRAYVYEPELYAYTWINIIICIPCPSHFYLCLISYYLLLVLFFASLFICLFVFLLLCVCECICFFVFVYLSKFVCIFVCLYHCLFVSFVL